MVARRVWDGPVRQRQNIYRDPFIRHDRECELAVLSKENIAMPHHRYVAAYTRSVDGTRSLLLNRSGAGLAAFPIYAAEQLSGLSGGSDEALASAAAAALCHGTGSLFAPAGGTAADAQMHLTAKITGRKGIHMLQADRFRLLLVPTTEVPTSGTTLTWVPAAALIGAPTEELVLPLSTVLASAASQLLLQRLATAVTASSASKKAAAEDEAYVVAIDPGVPRRLATDLFLGETAAAANKELLSMLGIVHVLLFASGMAAEQPKADQTHNGESSGGSASVEAATSVAASIGATLTVVDLGVCGDAARAGDAALLLGECCDLIEQGVANGGILMAGPVDSVSGVGPTWVACAYLAASAERVRVSQAFLRCRALHPGCRLTAELAAAADAFAVARKKEAADALETRARKKAASKAAREAYRLKKLRKGKAVAPTESSDEDEDEDEEATMLTSLSSREAKRRADAIIEQGGSRFVRVLVKPPKSNDDEASSSATAASGAPVVQEQPPHSGGMQGRGGVQSKTWRPSRPLAQSPQTLEAKSLPLQPHVPELPTVQPAAAAAIVARALRQEKMAELQAQLEQLQHEEDETSAAAVAMPSATNPSSQAVSLMSSNTPAVSMTPSATTSALVSPISPAVTAPISTTKTDAAACTATEDDLLVFRCRKCRAPLFTGQVLESHEPGGGQVAFKHHKRDHRMGGAVESCTSHFLRSDGQTNMKSTEDWGGCLQGKLTCAKCSTRVGDFNWSGMQCSCGAWVCPAIQVVKSKVDESRPPPPRPTAQHPAAACRPETR